MFFFVVAWFQAASAVAIVARPDRRLLLAIAVVNALVIVIWIWSKTEGLPIGPEAGEPEAVGAPDVLSTVLEALLIAWAIGMLSRIASRVASRRVGILTTAIMGRRRRRDRARLLHRDRRSDASLTATGAL